MERWEQVPATVARPISNGPSCPEPAASPSTPKSAAAAPDCLLQNAEHEVARHSQGVCTEQPQSGSPVDHAANPETPASSDKATSDDGAAGKDGIPPANGAPANDSAPVAGADVNSGAVSRQRPRPSLPASPAGLPASSPSASASASPATSRLPELRIPLGREDELPAARRALRFLYSGHVPCSIGFKDILATRRLGSYLQVDGCAAACDDAMVRKLEEEARAGCSAAVLDAYACWYHFPEDPSFSRVLAACQRHLVAHFRDAPAILNAQPDAPGGALRQFTSLPAIAMEALLASDDFATDSESSVLLLLAQYRDANPFRDCRRACRQIRAMHLSPTYLRHVLPSLSWFGDSCEQRAALAALAAAPDAHERSSMLTSLHARGVDLGPGLDLGWEGAERLQQQAPSGCKWLAPARRRCQLRRDRAFTWSASSDELAREARRAARVQLVSSCFTLRVSAGFTLHKPAGAADGAGGSSPPPAPPPAGATAPLRTVTAHGLRWHLDLRVSRAEAAHIAVCCTMPSLLAVGASGLHDLTRHPIGLSIQRPAANGAAAGGEHRTLPTDGYRFAPLSVWLPLPVATEAQHARAAAAAAATGMDPDLMEPWEAYVQPDRTVRGQISFGEAAPPPPTAGGRRGGRRRRGGWARAPRDSDDEDGAIEEIDLVDMMPGEGGDEDVEVLDDDDDDAGVLHEMEALRRHVRAVQGVIARRIQGDARLRG